MEKQVMTLTRALAELKMLGKKIEKYTVGDVLWCGVSVNGVVASRYNEDAVKASATHCKQELSGLIARRMEIKAKLLQANNSIKVNVGGNKMTIACAIDYKVFVLKERQVFDIIKSQVYSATTRLAGLETELQMKVDRAVDTVLGADAKKGSHEAAIKEITAGIRAGQKFELCDPLNIEKWAEENVDKCDLFLHEIDYVLSEANSVNTIEINA